MKISVHRFVGIIFSAAFLLFALILCVPFLKVQAAGSTNLLENPGAEEGDLSGWIDAEQESTGEGTFSVLDEYVWGSSVLDPCKGDYFFFAGVTPWNYIYQDVDVRDFPDGTVFTLSGYMNGWETGHGDYSYLQLDFLNRRGRILNSANVCEESIEGWDFYSVSLEKPEGAVTVRVSLIAERNSGSDCDSYFDEISLTADIKETEFEEVEEDKGTEEQDQDVNSYEVLWSNFNSGAVQNGAPVSVTLDVYTDVKIQAITTYHWNKGNGELPGSISIWENGDEIGSWDASARPGSGADNVYWDVFPDIVLEGGHKYDFVDSSPMTWSCNEESEYEGFLEIRGTHDLSDEELPQREGRSETAEESVRKIEGREVVEETSGYYRLRTQQRRKESIEIIDEEYPEDIEENYSLWWGYDDEPGTSGESAYISWDDEEAALTASLFKSGNYFGDIDVQDISELNKMNGSVLYKQQENGEYEVLPEVNAAIVSVGNALNDTSYHTVRLKFFVEGDEIVLKKGEYGVVLDIYTNGHHETVLDGDPFFFEVENDVEFDRNDREEKKGIEWLSGRFSNMDKAAYTRIRTEKGDTWPVEIIDEEYPEDIEENYSLWWGYDDEPGTSGESAYISWDDEEAALTASLFKSGNYFGDIDVQDISELNKMNGSVLYKQQENGEYEVLPEVNAAIVSVGNALNDTSYHTVRLKFFVEGDEIILHKGKYAIMLDIYTNGHHKTVLDGEPFFFTVEEDEGFEADPSVNAVTGGDWEHYPSGEWMYIKEDGTYAKDCWVESEGQYFCIDHSGYLLKDNYFSDGFRTDEFGIWDGNTERSSKDVEPLEDVVYGADPCWIFEYSHTQNGKRHYTVTESYSFGYERTFDMIPLGRSCYLLESEEDSEISLHMFVSADQESVTISECCATDIFEIEE